MRAERVGSRSPVEFNFTILVKLYLKVIEPFFFLLEREIVLEIDFHCTANINFNLTLSTNFRKISIFNPLFDKRKAWLEGVDSSLYLCEITRRGSMALEFDIYLRNRSGSRRPLDPSVRVSPSAIS